MNVKSLIQSKTFWFNVAKFAIGIGVAFSQAFPDSQWVGDVVMLESILSLFLRFQTTQPISGLITPQA